MIRTKGEAGTGNVVAAVTHASSSKKSSNSGLDDDGLDLAADHIMDRYRVLPRNSSLPGTHEVTPFGLDGDFKDGICEVLNDVEAWVALLW